MSRTNTTLPQPQIALDGKGLKIGIVVSRYNWAVTGTMLSLAQEELARLGVKSEHIRVVSVPGSYELPMGSQAMLTGETYDALICFGCVMKGETRHDVVVSDTAAQGCQRIALDTSVPIIFGVICAETQQQATERIVRSIECAQAAVEMARTVQSLSKRSKGV
ncbi:MAG: 6,7-dimethyl-8-ribityllumazine synthase [Ktedonobacteraceae bacterium]